MARPNRQSERRVELVEAARRAIGERGLLDLRLQDVAVKAGMSASTVFYYYPNLNALLEEVGRDAIERFCTRRAEAVADIDEPQRRLTTMIANGLPSGRSDELCRLLYELGTMSRRDPVHAARFMVLLERQVAIYMTILESGVSRAVFRLASDAVTIARNLVVLEDGYGLHAVNAIASFDRQTAERQIRAYASLAVGVDLEPFALST